MALSTAQQVTLKAAIIADPVMGILPQSNGSALQIASLLNLPASPAYVVYRFFVAMQEIMGNGWDWTRVDNLNVGKARIWEWMERTYKSGDVGGLNFVKDECRTGINAVWIGTSADRLVRDTVYAHSYRTATRLEKLFATGVGTAPVVNTSDGSGPGVLPTNFTDQNLLTYQDINAVMGWVV